MAPRSSVTPDRFPQAPLRAKAVPATRLAFNVDLVAITIALALAALIRLNVLPRIGW